MRTILAFFAVVCVAPVFAAESKPKGVDVPNFVIILADDMGYGDLGCYGHPTIRTPNLDRLAAEGQRWTSFYSAAEVCTPSRAGLLTGRLPTRSGMASNNRRVLFPHSAGGLPASEITIAEGLKMRGYATACIGKWHLGHLPQYLPTRHGFDYYFGLPYSNDMDRLPSAPKGRAAFNEPKVEFWNVPLIRNEQVIQRPVDQVNLTRRYTEEAVKFIGDNRRRPFLLYMPHTFPHVPLFASKGFAGKSRRGMYGDAIEELDWSVGEVVAALKKHKLEGNTLVVFTSDNGPWLTQFDQGGSAGPLRDGKGSTWEGGMRVPAIFWWPGRIRPAVVREMGAAVDLMPTLFRLAGLETPGDRVLDGVDIGPVLLGTGKRAEQPYFFYRGNRLMAVRHGRWKLHFQTQTGYGQKQADVHEPPLLFDLDNDPGEQYNVAAQNLQVVDDLRRIADEHRQGMHPPAQSELDKLLP